MKTLIWNGSPRPHGDTAALLQALQKGLEGEVRQVDAYRSDIRPCVDCRYCREHAGCCVQDGMQALYPYILDCDNVVIASPIYFSELTGPLLSLASRLQTFFSARYFRGEQPIVKQKRGAVLLCGGGDGAPDRAFATAETLLHQMRAVPLARLLSHDTDRLPAAADAEALHRAARLAARLNGGTFAEGAELLDQASIRAVLALSMFNPAPERLDARARACQQDPAVMVLALRESGTYVGAIVLRREENGAATILNLAAAPAWRGQAVGSRLLDEAVLRLLPTTLLAETDDGAVGFYRKYGFTVCSLGEKYPGTVRYACEWVRK